MAPKSSHGDSLVAQLELEFMNTSPSSSLPTLLPETPLEQFLKAAEDKTDNAAHQRLLKAVRAASPRQALESEFQAIVQEIVDDN